MTEIQNSKPPYHLKKREAQYVWVFDYWNLRFICNLVLGILDFTTLSSFITSSIKRNAILS